MIKVICGALFLLFCVFSTVHAQEFKLVKTLMSQHEVYNICFSPDEKFFSTSSNEETLIYSLSDFTIVKTLVGSYVYNMSFSPFGNYFSCIDNRDNELRVYSVPKFQLIKTFANPSKNNLLKLRQIGFDKKERFIEITTESIIELFSLPNFELVKVFVDINNTSTVVKTRDYSQNGKYFAAINSRFIVEIYSIKDYELIEGLKFQSEMPHSLHFSPDGRFLAVQTKNFDPNEPVGAIPKFDARKIKFYLMPEVKLVKTFLDNSGVVSGRFSPDGRFFVSVAHSENMIKVYLIPDLKLFKAITNHSDFVRAIAFSENGHYFASAAQDKKVNIYRITSGF